MTDESSSKQTNPKTGAGSEATQGTPPDQVEHGREHKSGYGGDGGEPKTSSDQREPKSPK